jgi:hypothetical protein
MMSYLVRREKFADGTPPPKKPYSAVQFKNKADTLLQGVYGTGKSSNAFLVDLMQKELDKAVEEGVVTMQEGLKFIKSRKKYYDDYLLEKSKTTDEPIGLPEVEERTELKNGSEEALKKINEAGAKRVTDKVERFKELVKLDKTPNEAKKIVIEEFDLQRGKSTGTPKWMTRGKSELIEEGVKFTESKRGPEPTGDAKSKAAEKRKIVTKDTDAAFERFKKDKQKFKFKDVENAHTANIFQAKALGVDYPTDAIAPQTSKQNQVYAEILNDELKPLYKEQLKLKKAFDQTPTKEISALINKNNTAIQNLVASGGKQGKKAANLLRGWNVDVVTGEVYLPEGGFNTLKAVDRGMTDTTLQNLKAKTADDVVARANYEELLKEMKGKKIPVPEKSKTRDMFNKAFKVGKMVSKPIIRAVSPFIPIVGTAGTLMGAADVAEASTFTKKPDDLGIAYLAGPEVAKKYGEFKDSVRGKSDEFEEFVP